MTYTVKEVHKNEIVHGDTIVDECGNMRTVTLSNINDSNRFVGRTIFGDCYHLGYKLVKKVIFQSTVQ